MAAHVPVRIARERMDSVYGLLEAAKVERDIEYDPDMRVAMTVVVSSLYDAHKKAFDLWKIAHDTYQTQCAMESGRYAKG